MIPVLELNETVVVPDREAVTPIREHLKKIFDSRMRYMQLIIAIKLMLVRYNKIIRENSTFIVVLPGSTKS